MTWTDIGPNEEACAILMDVMIKMDAERTFYNAHGGPITGANKGHVLDELFQAWEYLCTKDRLPVDGPPLNLFAAWSAGIGVTA